MIAAPYIFSLETPLIIFNGRLFQATEQVERDQDFIDLRTSRYGLEQISLPIDFERLQFEHEKTAVQEFKQRYVQETLQKELLSKEFVEKQISENKVLSFIINKVLPTLTGAQLEQQFDNLLTGQSQQDSNISLLLDNSRQTNVIIDNTVIRESQRLKEQLLNALNQEYKQYQGKEDKPYKALAELIEEFESTQYSRIKDGSVLNELLIPNYRFLIINDKVCSLITSAEYLESQKDHLSTSLRRRTLNISPTIEFSEIEELLKSNKDEIEKDYRSKIMNKFRTTKLNIGGLFFIPIFSGKTQELIEPYKKLLEKQIKTQALNENETQAQQLQAIAREKHSLEDLANQTSFERNNAGFEVVNQRYYVFIKTPAYALKSPHNNNFYEFRSAKIGVSIERHGIGFYISPVIIMNEYKHPFLSGTISMQNLCVGQYNYEYRERGMTPEQKIISRLSLGKQIVMAGYGTGINPYRKLLEENFSNQKIFEAEVKRKKLPVLNILNEARGVA